MWLSRAILLAGVLRAVAAADFSVGINVTDLPKGSEFVTVSAPVDFTQLLRAHNTLVPVDERTLRLFDERGREIPYQFSASPQPRPKSRLLAPGTSPNVSYAAEYAVTNVPPNLRVSGELSWIVTKAKSTKANFEIRFSTPKSGLIVQTPFPPENFRMFDDAGRTRSVRWFPNLKLHPQWPMDGVVHFSENTNLITSYHLGPAVGAAAANTRRPYFYPVYGPDHIGLTEFGKPHDPTGSHAHHYSLWIAHNDVDGASFWSERGGIIAHESLDLMDDGPIFSRVVQKARWQNQNRDVLRETRTITAYKAARNFRCVDIEIALTPASSNSVTFGKTSFGFLAARVAQSMTVFDGAGEIRTSEGKLNESGAHLTHAKWLDQSGPIAQGKWGGIAILDSPDNPNFPTGWHCRNDGWAGTAFNMDAPHKLEAAKQLHLRYRVILHRGDATNANIDRRFEEWAGRPKIKLSVVKKL
jgi:hypothetical protein